MSLLLLLFQLYACQGLYIDPGNPYDVGPLMSTINSTTFNIGDYGAPVKTEVYYPDYNEEEIGVSIFIGGYYGLMPASAYSETLTMAASHGFAVVAFDTLDSMQDYEQNLLDALDWAQANLNTLLPCRLDWTNVQFTCHSAGCHGIMLLLRARPDYAKSTVMTDPVSFDILRPINITMPPGLFLATALAGRCVVENITSEVFYAEWNCPRILQTVQGYGHCDFLDPIPWQVCHSLGYCETGPLLGIPAQRRFVQGLFAGMFMWQEQGQTRVLDYLINPDLIPVTLDVLQHDVLC